MSKRCRRASRPATISSSEISGVRPAAEDESAEIVQLLPDAGANRGAAGSGRYLVAVLQLAKKSVTSTYRVTDHVRTGQISVTADPAVLEGDGPDLRIDCTPPDHASFRMVVAGQTVATATDLVEPIRKLEYRIEFQQGAVELRKPAQGLKPFAVLDGDGATQIGSVVIGRITGRKLTVEVSDGIPFEVRLFLGWLAMRHWNAAANQKIVQ